MPVPLLGVHVPSAPVGRTGQTLTRLVLRLPTYAVVVGTGPAHIGLAVQVSGVLPEHPHEHVSFTVPQYLMVTTGRPLPAREQP